MADFKVGEVVRLKSGGPDMTVAGIGAAAGGGKAVRCVWFTGCGPDGSGVNGPLEHSINNAGVASATFDPETLECKPKAPEPKHVPDVHPTHSEVGGGDKKGQGHK